MSMYIRSFIPWIIFACFPNRHLFLAAVVAFAVGALVTLQDLRRGTAADALILEWSTVGFFAVLSVAAHVSTGPQLAHWSGVLAFSWLAATAWATLAVRHPFTLGIARKSTPQEYWNTPQFRRINVVITYVWAWAFTLTAVAIAVCFGAGLGKAADYTCQVLGFVVPAIFTARYPKIARARMLAAADA
jgi:hypothetical protein